METGLKFYITMELEMKQPLDDSTKLVYFQTSSSPILKTTKIIDVVKKHTTHIVEKVEKYVRNGSGFLVENVYMIKVMTAKYNPMGGSTYIKLPASLAKKQSLLNIKNNDNRCCCIAYWQVFTLKSKTTAIKYVAIENMKMS